MSQPTDSAEGQHASESTPRASTRPFQIPLGGLLVLFIIVAFVMGMIAAVRRRVDDAECSNHLRAIGIALHGYHSATGSFPPAQLVGPDGRPWHSWRNLVHPYLAEHGRGLYGLFVEDEPWDSPAWIAEAATMYERDKYVCPVHGSDNPDTTSYVAVIGPDTAWPGGESVRIDDITDGSAQTILVVEIPDCSIYWMEPRDLDFDGLLKALREHGSLRVLYADGRVGTIYASIPRDQLRALLTIAGGEEIEPEFRP